MSVGLHGLILAVLVYLTPVRQIVREFRQGSHPVSGMSARELANLAETIEVHAADQIASNARELGSVLDQMNEVQGGIAEKFGAFAQRQQENGARDALQAMGQAAEQMRAAADSIQNDSEPQITDRLQALAESAQERARRKLEVVESGLVSIATGQRAAEEAHQQAKAVHDQHTTQMSRLAGLERSAAAEQARAEQMHQQLQKSQGAKRPQAQIDQESARLTAQQQRADGATEDLEAARQDQGQLHSQEAESQRVALAAQEEVMGALRKLMEGQSGGASLGPQPPTAVAGLPEPRTGPGGPRPAGPEAVGAQGTPDVVQIYHEARALEDGIAERFKEVRAMDLAMVRDMTLEDARKDIELIRPVRPDLNVELLREAARNEEDFEAHKEEVRTALRETSSMVNLGRRMLEMATQSVAKMKFGTNVRLSPDEEAPDFRLIIRELAMEDVSGRFSDLAGMMEALGDEQGGQGAAGNRTGSPGGGDGGAGGRGTKLDYQDLTAEELGGAGALPRFGDKGEGEGGLMPELRPDVPAVGARKISPDGRPGNWMFVDTWYTVGPFPNPNRVNIDREFPPDSLVDLDATYVGKDGQRIRWRFVQSDVPMVRPPNAEPYGIWYAYTEFYCDRPRDVIIALGTDDRGTLKINGLPVWISSKQLKGWDIDEVWRRVHFNQGINRILYRVENGWQTMGFSLVLRLEEP
jgi:hypothetical protein